MKAMKHIESNIQKSCITWFNLQYPQYRGLLYHVPNGGKRGTTEAARMKLEGVVAVVWDLSLDVPSGGYHGAKFEMKSPTGRLTELQKEWGEKVEKQVYYCAVVHSVEQLIYEIKNYLK